MSAPVFQHFATSSDHAENVCIVTFRALRAHLVWNTRLARVFQWNSRVFQCAELSSVVVNIPASVREDVNRPGVPVRIDCTAVFLLSRLTVGLWLPYRWCI